MSTTDQPACSGPPKLPSHQILVDRFEVALIWPVLVQARRDKLGNCTEPKLDPAEPDFLDHWIARITGAGTWQEHQNRGDYPALDGADAEPSYSEFCYLHPFVRNFLYSTRGDLRDHHELTGKKLTGDDLVQACKNRNLRILQRDDVESFSVGYGIKPHAEDFVQVQSRFRVDSCWIYLFDTQIAMLELRLIHERSLRLDDPDAEQPLNLRMVLKLQDILRRTYAPYWHVPPAGDSDATTGHFAGHVPDAITLKFKDSDREVISNFGSFTAELPREEVIAGRYDGKSAGGTPDRLRQAAIDHRRHVFRHREPYTVGVWRELLAPIEPTTFEKAADGPGEGGFPLRFEYIQDERIPLMSYVAVGSRQKEQPLPVRQIEDGDWLRLAFADDEGDSNRYPYSPEFFAGDPLAEVAYDRFWHSTGVPPGHPSYQSTRWLCCGYAFVAVGDAADRDFFTDEHAGALCHFRHHYFALTMIALFHRASLLRFKHRLAEAADALLNDHETELVRNYDFRRETDRLMPQLLRFRTLYWFSEVSNQVQAIELFKMFRKHLNLDELFDDVYADADSAASLLRQWDEEQTAKVATALAILGALFFAVTPAFDLLKAHFAGHPICASASVFIAILGLVFLFVPIPHRWWIERRWLRKFAGRPPWRWGRLFYKPTWLVRLLLCVLVVAGVAGLYRCYTP